MPVFSLAIRPYTRIVDLAPCPCNTTGAISALRIYHKNLIYPRNRLQAPDQIGSSFLHGTNKLSETLCSGSSTY